MIVYIISSILFPGFIGGIIDEINAFSSYRAIFIKCLLMFFVGIVVVISNYVEKMAFASLGKDISKVLKELTYQKIIRSNYAFWNKYTVGDIITILEKDIDSIELFLSNTLLGILTNSLLICGLLFYIGSINVFFGIILFIIAMFFGCFYNIIGKKAKSNYAELRDYMAEFLSFVNETLNNMLSIQMTGHEKMAYKNFRKENIKVISKTMRHVKLSGLTNSVGILYNVLTVFIIFTFGAGQSIRGLISLGDLFNLVLYTQRIYSPILTLSANYLEAKKTLTILNKIVMLFESDNIIKNGYYKTEYLTGNITFENVCFEYNDRKNIISEFNYIINKGDIVGIIGDNGCGKSTLMKLLTKNCKVNKGHIYIDGIDIDNYEIESLRNIIGCLPQNYYLMSGDLRQILDPYNIYTDEKIIETCNDFMIDIKNFHEGLHTVVGENKINLSGGEAQKILLARLMLENKPVNIIDEPTSEMDIKSEKIICEVLPKYLNGKTTLIITHRRAILKICKKTFEMERKNNISTGAITESN